MTRLPRKRHLRHGNFERTDRSKHLRAFLAARAADLEDTGASEEFTIDTDVPAIAATGTLTFADNPANEDEVTIGDITYVFVTALSTEPDVPYEIQIGGAAGDTAQALVDAINGDENALVAVGTDPHPDVTADLETLDVVVTSRVAGVAGNSIATTTDGTDLSWGDTDLQDGADAIEGTGEVTITAHGWTLGEGPFILTSTDDLPLGLIEGRLYWIAEVVDVNTFTLTTKRGNTSIVIPQDPGNGTHTITKADAIPAIYEYLRQNHPEVVRDAVSVDEL